MRSIIKKISRLFEIVAFLSAGAEYQNDKSYYQRMIVMGST